MNTPLINTIITENQAFQRLKTTDGPAPLMVGFVGIKTLITDLLKTDPDNLSIIEALHLLQDQGWQDASSMLDHYEEEQQEKYQIAFFRLQALVATAVNTIQAS
ncbi:hypothetical protein [Spirosoma radiotolerans]|uniref:Uncharacterized protein n=1 Tax=Spirosoma radiotolerans TaxID=1379870 RepID=A0A0E3V9C7_9BACT|nr:hypothetical protein [Spirosoma radiotolerans]AKD57026.1 hypothetical protein SD10_21135 [Spirosoma radiotolerans]